MFCIFINKKRLSFYFKHKNCCKNFNKNASQHKNNAFRDN